MMLLQLAAAVLAGLVFLALGRREALAAVAGGALVALGTVLLSLRFFRGVSGAGQVLGRFLVGTFLKWIVIAGGLVVILVHYKLPPPAAITGLVAAYAANLLVFRFKG